MKNSKTYLQIELVHTHNCLQTIVQAASDGHLQIYDEAIKMLNAHLKIARSYLHTFQEDEEEVDQPSVSILSNGFDPVTLE